MRVLILAFLPSTLGWYNGMPEPDYMTTGGVWPLPQSINYGAFNHTVNPTSFYFTTSVQNCEILSTAFTRYRKLMFASFDSKSYSDSTATLYSAAISVSKGCDAGYPQMEMDESYNLVVEASKNIATITANEVWGALRALETLSQLVYLSSSNKFRMRTATIADSPRFPHRGILLDSARHFLPVGVILQNLDLMAQSKMNVFHWHIVDSQSFPYPSLLYPNLTKYGAYSPAHQYTVSDIQKIMDYARLRGIRVIPEFDTPGHAGSWGNGIPNLVGPCYNSQNILDLRPMPNMIDASYAPNYDFLAGFFGEALSLFKDNFMHFGGDEVQYDLIECWYNNPNVRQRMKELGLGSDPKKLLNYYWQKMFQIIESARPGTKKVVWQEVLDLDVQATGSIAHVWKGETYKLALDEMAKVTAAGHQAIFSSCWYLNYIKYGDDWGHIDREIMQERGMYYECDPTDFEGTEQQKSFVLGGEAAMWGEYVDGTNLISRLWPRASAAAERLWSDPKQTTSADVAWPRLHEMRCRLIRRGFPAEPLNGPDYCAIPWNPAYVEL